MDVRQLETIDAAAESVVRELEDLLAVRPAAVLGWPSGRTTLPVLRLLTARHRVSFAEATIIMMDDYALRKDAGFVNCPPAAHYSCPTWVSAYLRPALEDENAAGPRVLVPSAAAPTSYEQQIVDLGGVDLFLVGIGSSDAHIAFNPPGAPIDSRTRVVELAASTRQDNLSTFPEFLGLSDVPTHGVTVGIGTIVDARRVIAMAHGADKVQIVSSVIATGRYRPGLPATALFEHHNAQLIVAGLSQDETP